MKPQSLPQIFSHKLDEIHRGHLGPFHAISISIISQIGNLGEGQTSSLRLRFQFWRSIRQGPPFDAFDFVAGNIGLKNDASMVYKLLENNGGSELDQSLGVEDERHLVRFRRAIGDQGFCDDWERKQFQQIIGIIQ
uniref:Uncharacterized protein n=1 Tax=Opuntia streptacantha TaxID=393608 RepID=A0A7C9DNK3_OPUST